MTPQPPYEMQDAYILTKEDWLKLREHLTIGCTNQKAFLDSLVSTSRPASSPDPRVAFFEEDNAYKDSIIEQQRIHINTLNVKMSEMMQGAAAKAREKVLDELKMRCNKEWESTDKERRKATRTFVTTGVKTDITPHKWVCASMNMVVGWIESLRTGANDDTQNNNERKM